MKEPRKERKKRDVKINVDTEKVDASFERTEDGDMTVKIDSERVDVNIEKTDEKLTIDIDIDDRKVYEFEANGKNHRLPKGAVIKVSGAILKLFLQKGFGRLKK